MYRDIKNVKRLMLPLKYGLRYSNHFLEHIWPLSMRDQTQTAKCNGTHAWYANYLGGHTMVGSSDYVRSALCNADRVPSVSMLCKVLNGVKV